MLFKYFPRNFFGAKFTRSRRRRPFAHEFLCELQLEENAPSALSAFPVVQAAFWTRASRAGLVLPTLRFAGADVAAVRSYCCHLVRVTSTIWMRRQSLASLLQVPDTQSCFVILIQIDH